MTLWIILIPFEHGIPKVSAPWLHIKRVLMSGMPSSLGVTLHTIASIKNWNKKLKLEVSMHLITLTLSPKQHFSVYLECNYQTESVLHQRQGILKNEKPMFPSSKHFTSLFFFFFFMWYPMGLLGKLCHALCKDYTFRGDYLFWERPTPTPLSYRLLVDDLLFMGIPQSTT